MSKSDGVPMLRNLVGYNPSNVYPLKDAWRLLVVIIRTYKAWSNKWARERLLLASKSHEMACIF